MPLRLSGRCFGRGDHCSLVRGRRHRRDRGCFGRARSTDAIGLSADVSIVAPDLRLSFRGASTKFVKRILSFSTSMLLIDASSSLQTKADEMVIGAFMPVSNVSPYSLARRSAAPQMIAERFVWASSPHL